nr:gamma-butyrobetaine dioxygenase-like [Lytechinus pictus]
MADVITKLKRDDDKAWFNVEWSDGYKARFPYVFLFDNCRCPKCFHPNSYQRSVLMANIDPDIRPAGHEIIEGGKVIQVTWPNGNVSPYPAKWLKMHQFGKKPYDPLEALEIKSWGKEKQQDIPTFNYKEVMEDNKVLYEWLVKLLTDGITLIKGTPGVEGIVAKLHERVSWTRRTIYGEIFNVITMYDACSLAYTAKQLGLHVDLPGFYQTPGVQMLHCIKQVDSEGGDNEFVDGLRVAEQLEQEYPKIFQRLTTMKVDFRTLGAEFVPYHTMTQRPVIEYDRDGVFQGINYNDGVRAPYWSLPVEEITEGYRAMKTFHRAMYDKRNCIYYKMEKGDMVIFDNRRVLHGRLGFEVHVKEGEESKKRHLEGGYLDWDGIKSKMRLLHEEIHGLERF